MRWNFSLKKGVGLGAAVFILAYVLFQSRFMILGPQISIISPENGATVPSGLVILKGTAKNVSYISLNDRPIFLDSSGSWSEKMILSPGASIMTIKARDRFGREKTETLTLFIK